jgi:transposase-like protein
MTSKTTKRFSPEVRARAVRMVQDHGGEYPSRLLTVQGTSSLAVANRHGCGGTPRISGQ